MIYQFREGSRLGGDPQMVGRAIEGIRGGLTPAAVASAARAEDNYLHRYFTWDDSEAARKQRLHEARVVMACVYVVELTPTQTTPVRAFVAVGSAEDRYVPVQKVLSQESLRRRMLEQALGDLESFRDRYSELKELSAVFLAIEQVEITATATS